jgi:anti-sigma regulatory factor (Ser/Thr protein kinase)
MRESPEAARSRIDRLPNATSTAPGDPGRGPGVETDRAAITLSFTLENDSAQIAPVVAKIMDAAGRFCLFDEAVANRVALALEEAILNAMHHGNLELDSRLRHGDERDYQRLASERRSMDPYQGRRVHLEARLDADAARIVIRDEGPGFDPGLLPDPTRPPCLDQASGRGLLLIRSYMDEMAFNASGSEITLVKKACRE